MGKLSIVVMGVTGCGKTSVGKHLAQALSFPYYDADDFHPTTNIKKMSRGVPLTDEDRAGWLRTLRALIETNEAEGEKIILACSALKNTYRKILTVETSPLFVFLEVSRETANARLKKRSNHYMPSSLVESQFEILEKPLDAIYINAELSLDEVNSITLNKVRNRIGGDLKNSCN